MTFDDLRGSPSVEKWNTLLTRLEALRVASGPGIRVSQSPQGQVVAAIRSFARPADRDVSFDVTEPQPTETEEGEAFTVTVSEGLLIERDVRNGEATDALIYHEADNHRDENGNLRKFEVAAGDSMFLVVEVDKLGRVAITPEDPPEDPPPPAVTLAVMPSDTASVHYEPEIGAGTANQGAPGTYHYRLADFIAGAAAGSVVMVPKMAGQDIDHWQDLPTFQNAGGATIWKEWDASQGVYKTKGITAQAPLTATARENDIQLGFDGGANLKLKVIGVELGFDSENEGITFGSPYIVAWHFWKNGIYVGQTDPFGSEESVPTTEVHYLANAPAQIA
jgi:hypothetical protein